MAIRPKPLILLENEDIKFVEDDFSSSSSEKNPSSGNLKQKRIESKSTIQTKTEESNPTPENKEEKRSEGTTPFYTEITVIPNQSDHYINTEKPMENLKPPPTQDFPTSSSSSSLRSNRSIGFISNILSRSPRLKRKYRRDYEMVAARDEDSIYSNASAASANVATGATRRSNTEIRKNDPKVEEDEQILEALRHVVRKCTNQDPMKRPSSRDLFDLVGIAYDKS